MTIAATELVQAEYYASASAAARNLQIPYKRLISRLNGAKPRSKNGGNRTLFTEEEEKAIFAWAWRRVTQGHHIQYRTLRQYANSRIKSN